MSHMIRFNFSDKGDISTNTVTCLP